MSAQDADLYSWEVQPGDVLIAATDGLWDNTYDDEVMEFLPAGPDDLQRARFIDSLDKSCHADMT